jgi:radical SAM-linked protein
LRLIVHRDLMRCFERLFRRAGLALGMSEGFHPKPRMTFPSALAVGIEARCEVMELELTESPAAEELLARLSAQAPPGLHLGPVEVLPLGARKARVCAAVYRVPVPPARCAGLEERISALLAAESCLVRRPTRAAAIDLRGSLESLSLQEGVLEMRLRTDVSGSAGPRDVLGALGLDDLERDGIHLTRTAVEIDS